MTDLTTTAEFVCGYADDADQLERDIERHLMSTLGADPRRADRFRCFMGLTHAMRDQLVRRWIETQRAYYDGQTKRVYYLSLEFLLGRLLSNCLINLDMEDTSRTAVQRFGHQLQDMEDQESEAGLGNGGLGRLAACFLDSIATLGLPAYGYGIRYDYGMFHQKIVDGYQVENPDTWLRYGNPWEIARPEYLYRVRFGGRVESLVRSEGQLTFRWVDTEDVLAMPCDILIPGFRNGNVINLRLWAAKATREFNLEYFQKGNYVEAIQEKAKSENISKVLYPSEEVREGRELRLKQEYFFVSATFQDILRRYKKRADSFELFPERIAIQLNDTHPAIAIPELMRVLMDEEGLGWEEAWSIGVRTFGYTNHTIMPEALETWPVDMLGRILPRHLQIIYEINRRFLNEVAERFPGDTDRLRRMSLIQEDGERRVRMAHLALVGSHSVNGVAQVHTRILKERVFRDFYEMFPQRFNNKTNGVTPRRWLLQANPHLSRLISQTVGTGWPADLSRLRELIPLADDPSFRASWREAKWNNKIRLAEFILSQTGLRVDPGSLFDVQVKRIHEYKRQVLNVFHVVALYDKIRKGQVGGLTPRTVIFGGKAAPGYRMAGLIIKLINSVARTINADPAAKQWLRVVFIPNYCVSAAEKIIPGADLSQQISLAGTEASGTGNMKFALNGALTIGTMDGANIEIAEAVGEENMFLFGLGADEVEELRARGYHPRDWYGRDEDLKTVVDMVASGEFSDGEPELFRPLIDSLLQWGDRFMVLADFRDYLRCQEDVGRTYLDTEEWTRRSILNVACMDRFSSDWTISRYAEDIWQVAPVSHPTSTTRQAR